MEDTLDVKRFELGNNAPFEHAPPRCRRSSATAPRMCSRWPTGRGYFSSITSILRSRRRAAAWNTRGGFVRSCTICYERDQVHAGGQKGRDLLLAARTRYGATTLPLLLTVRDEGVGIAKDDLPLIFLKYIKAGTKHANQGGIDKHSGAGIGLSLVKSIVESYDGSVDVESELGVGSAFRSGSTCRSSRWTRSWRRREAGSSRRPSWRRRGRLSRAATCSRRRRRRDEQRDVMCTMLRESLGCTSEEAEDGTEAVAAVRASMKPGGRRFDACFMDIQMQEMSGLEAAAAIRELEASNGNERLRIIALTGFASAEDRERCPSCTWTHT